MTRKNFEDGQLRLSDIIVIITIIIVVVITTIVVVITTIVVVIITFQFQSNRRLTMNNTHQLVYSIVIFDAQIQIN